MEGEKCLQSRWEFFNGYRVSHQQVSILIVWTTSSDTFWADLVDRTCIKQIFSIWVKRHWWRSGRRTRNMFATHFLYHSVFQLTCGENCIRNFNILYYKVLVSTFNKRKGTNTYAHFITLWKVHMFMCIHHKNNQIETLVKTRTHICRHHSYKHTLTYINNEYTTTQNHACKYAHSHTSQTKQTQTSTTGQTNKSASVSSQTWAEVVTSMTLFQS